MIQLAFFFYSLLADEEKNRGLHIFKWKWDLDCVFAIAMSGSWILFFLLVFVTVVVAFKLKTCPFGVPSKNENQKEIENQFEVDFFFHPSN